jgi:hypothetical protein
MREPNGDLFDLEPPRQRRFAGSKVAMDQKGGCGILYHIPRLTSYETDGCTFASGAASLRRLPSRPVYLKQEKIRL